MSNPKLFRNFQKSHFLIEESRRTFKYVSLKLKSKKLAYFTTGCHNFFLCKFLKSLPFVKSICKKLKATSLTHTFYQSFVLGPSCNVFSSKFPFSISFPFNSFIGYVYKLKMNTHTRKETKNGQTYAKRVSGNGTCKNLQ